MYLSPPLAADPFDNGFVWGYDGANPGIYRKIIAVDGSTGTPIVAFPNDIAAGDNFLGCPTGPGELAGVALTTDLTQVDTENDQQTKAPAR